MHKRRGSLVLPRPAVDRPLGMTKPQPGLRDSEAFVAREAREELAAP
jgi:hypothetical protein